MDITTNWSVPSNFSLHPEIYFCADFNLAIFLLAFAITKSVLIIPLAMLVLYLGHQRWRQQRSFKTTSQSDLITYHTAFMQLFGVPGLTIYACGFYASYLFHVGVHVLSVVVFGELLFHVLTCVERYLAVVHPITYLELKNNKGAKIRRISVGGVWVLSFGWIIPLVLYAPKIPIVPFFCIYTISFIIVSFCSLSVLWALIRPGPGEVVGKKEHVDQSKQKAFHTIMAITGALWLLFFGYVVCVALNTSELLSYNAGCWVAASASWFSLPSSLMVPLLFLHRAGKLGSCCAEAD